MAKKRKPLRHNKRKTKRTRILNRNWDNLPSDVMIIIFLKLNTVEILCNAQFVSSYWRKLTKDCRLFCSIVIPDTFRQRYSFKYNYLDKFTEFGMDAVNRSNGELTEIYVEKDVTSKLLWHIVSKSNSLRYIGLPSCYNIFWDDNVLLELAEKNPLLEELGLGHTESSVEVIKKFGTCCLELKSFSFNYGEYPKDGVPVKFLQGQGSDVAKVIAKYMSKLHELSLSGGGVTDGGGLTDSGLRIILERCTQLEYLDLGQCSLGMVRNTSLNKCFHNIKVVKLPSSDYDTTSSCVGTDYYSIEDVKLPSSSYDITSSSVGTKDSDLAHT